MKAKLIGSRPKSSRYTLLWSGIVMAMMAVSLVMLLTIPAATRAASQNPEDTVAVHLDGNDIASNNTNGLTFKGFGVLSGNGTSALLMDYKSEQPDVYAKMMKTLFGGSQPIMTNLKLEMGNDRNNSTGSEPATQRTESEAANVTRDQGFQLVADAKKINPNLKVTILRWNAPGWAKTNDQIYTWYKNSILNAYRTYGYMVDYVNPGLNEHKPDLAWAKEYAKRVKTDNTGFKNDTERQLYNKIKVVISDEVGVGSFGKDMVTDSSLRNAVTAAGYHYSTEDDSAKNFTALADKYDKEVWNSEAQATFGNSDYRPNSGTGIGGAGSSLEMANTIVKGFTDSRRTNFIYQPAIAAFYEGGQYSSKSVLQATDPWSGWTNSDVAIDVLAQFSKFAKLGWENSDNTSGIWRAVSQASVSTATGSNNVNGRNGLANYLTLASPDKKDFSTVIVNDSKYTKHYQISASNMAYKGTPTLEEWETRAADTTAKDAYDSNYLKHVGDVQADSKGVYTVTVKPFSIKTVTTLDKAKDSDLNQGISASSNKQRTVLDTDANGKGTDTSDTTLYADNFEYGGKKVATLNADGTSNTAKTEDFITSRGGDEGFYPLYTFNRNGTLEGYKTTNAKSGHYVLRQQLDSTVVEPGGAWNDGDALAWIGDNRWMNYKASTDVSFEDKGTHGSANYASIGARQQADSGPAAYLKFWQDGGWSLHIGSQSVASGNVATGQGGTKISGFDTTNTAWHNIAIQAAGNTITASIDGQKVADGKVTSELSGRVTLGSGYFHTDFDNLKVETVKGYTPYYSQQIDDLEMYDTSATPKQQLVYNDHWTHETGQGMYLRDRTVSKNTGAGATLTYTFTGTGLDICGNNDGSAKLDVTVDGKQVATDAATNKADNLGQTYTLRNLKYGQHTVTFTVKSGTLAVDYVGVVPSDTIADFSKLQTAYDKVKDVTNADNKYTSSSWTSFQKVLLAAKNVLADTTASQNDIDTALKNLNTAYAALALNPDKTKLQTAYDKAKAVTNPSDKYTDASWKVFQTALTDAQDVLANANATQNDVDSALKNLNQAASDLVLNPAKPDKTKLQAAYDKNKAVTNPDDKYTSESWQALQTALSDAQKVLTDTNATQNDVDSALKSLNQAATDLTLNPAKPGKTKLQAAYDKNKTVTNPDDKYTSESWQAFQKALSDAQKVLADTNATQDSLDTTLQKLNNAYAGLKLNSQKPDKSALQTAYDKDSTVTNQANKYTTASWTTFQSALANAKKVLADTDAVQADVDTALQKLNNAYDGLTLSPDKSALQTVLTEAQTLSHSAVTGDHEGNYPADALKTLQVAIDTAKKVADNPDASKDDIDTAASTLKQAVTAFKQTVVTVNRDQLTQLVTESQTLRADDYNQNSWTPYQQAVAAAQKLLAGKPSQQELDAAATALKKAKTSLVAAPTGKLPSTGDASSESASSSEETASSSTAKYPSTGESQLSLAVTMAAVVFLIGISGFAWFLHQKGKAK